MSEYIRNVTTPKLGLFLHMWLVLLPIILYVYDIGSLPRIDHNYDRILCTVATTRNNIPLADLHASSFIVRCIALGENDGAKPYSFKIHNPLFMD